MRRLSVVLLSAVLANTALGAGAEHARDVLPDGTVRFASGSSDLTPESQATVERLAKILKKRPELDPVLLVGHADDRGSQDMNIPLSRSRAEVVKQTLVKLGIRASRLRTRGAGSAEPLVSGTTDEARATNRRVEVWVTPQDTVATVARVERVVKSKDAAAPGWKDARVDMPLRRLAQVRTMKRSASEIRFERNDRVGLGPEALVVIFGSPSRTKRSKRRVADIEVQAGSIFASLARRERQLDVETDAGSFAIQSKKARLDVPRRRRGAKKRKKKKRTSRISVFDGKSRVTGAGKTVEVKKGWGTRVTEGEAPEPPKPLPPAPQWKTARPLEVFEGQPVPLEWTRATNVPAVEVQIGAAADAKVQRPLRLERIEGDRTKLAFVKSGLFHVRLAGIDERDIRGEASVTRRIVVWPRLNGTMKVEGDIVQVLAPQTAEIPAPSGTQVATSSTATTTAQLRVDLVRPGEHIVPYVVSSTAGPSHTGRLKFEVATASVAGEPVVMNEVDGVARVEGRFRVTANDRAVPSLALLAGIVPAATPRLVSGAMQTCHCASPGEVSPVVDEGDGYYRFSLPAPAGRGPIVVRIVEPRGPVAFELVGERPTATKKIEPVAPPKPDGWFAGLSSGALLGGSDAPSFSLFGEAGHRFHLGGPVELDASARFGWFGRTADDDSSVDVFPLVARATGSWVLGVPRIYAGVGGGARFTSPSSGAGYVAEGFFGLGYAVGTHGELRVEASYTSAASVDELDGELAGFMVNVAFRLGTWRTVKD